MSGNTNYGLGTSDTTGTNNTSLGVAVLSKITSSAENNTGVGTYSLANNTDGISNVAVGSNSLLTNTSGDYNTALGTASLVFNTTGSSNVALGSNSLQFNTVGSSNVGSGTQSLYKNTTGDDNTSIGTYSQYNNTIGSYNVSLGSDTLYNNTASNNTAIGYGAMYLNKSGTENVALGTDSLNGNTGGSYNVALGVIAGSNNINGNYNTFVGYNSGSSGSTGSYSTAIGYNSKFSGDHQIVLGTTAEIVIVPGMFQLGSTSGNSTSGVTGAVYYNPMEQSIYFSNGVAWRSTALTVQPSVSATDLYPGGATLSQGLTGTVLQMGVANATNPGLVSTANQTFAGVKTFSGGISTTAITNSTIGNSNTIILNTAPNTSAGALSYLPGTGFGNQFTIGNGTVVGAPKTFIIDHPSDKEKYLVHGCLEGPEAGVYYRGTEKITNGESVSLTLPSYVEKLAHNFTVQVTPIYDGKINTCNVSRIKEGQFTVYGANCEFDWIVYGTRERINAEPKKTEVVVKGDGPYKYIV